MPISQSTYRVNAKLAIPLVCVTGSEAAVSARVSSCLSPCVGIAHVDPAVTLSLLLAVRLAFDHAV